MFKVTNSYTSFNVLQMYAIFIFWEFLKQIWKQVFIKKLKNSLNRFMNILRENLQKVPSNFLKSENDKYK